MLTFVLRYQFDLSKDVATLRALIADYEAKFTAAYSGGNYSKPKHHMLRHLPKYSMWALLTELN